MNAYEQMAQAIDARMARLTTAREALVACMSDDEPEDAEEPTPKAAPQRKTAKVRKPAKRAKTIDGTLGARLLELVNAATQPLTTAELHEQVGCGTAGSVRATLNKLRHEGRINAESRPNPEGRGVVLYVLPGAKRPGRTTRARSFITPIDEAGDKSDEEEQAPKEAAAESPQIKCPVRNCTITVEQCEAWHEVAPSARRNTEAYRCYGCTAVGKGV